MAHQKGFQVLVDGAHCKDFAFKLSDLGCDYTGPVCKGYNLLAWLIALRPNIFKIWPLFADYEKTILKLNASIT